jgi:hypothetical protein
VIDGKITAVPRGIMAAGNVMPGARGGADLPRQDIDRVKSHLAKYYKKMGEDAPGTGTEPTRPCSPRRDNRCVPAREGPGVYYGQKGGQTADAARRSSVGPMYHEVAFGPRRR